MIARLLALSGLLGLATAFAWGLPHLTRPPERFEVALALLESGRPDAAAHVFDDPAWRGVAEYEAGRHWRAAAAFLTQESVLMLYNAGNSYARLHEWEAAKAAYRKVLQLDSGHDDARHNLEIVLRAEALERALLAQSRAERRLGRSQEGMRRDLEQSAEGGERIEPNEASGAGPQPTEVRAERGGRSDQPGRLGDEPSAKDAEAGAAQAGVPGASEAEGRSAADTVAARRESAQAAEVLLRAIEDDPAKVLAARLNAVHRRRLEGGFR